jgi:hypothetical protein
MTRAEYGYALAVQNDGYALAYVPQDKITFEIIKLAAQENVYALQYVLKDDIIKLAVQNNGCALEYVPEDKMSR